VQLKIDNFHGIQPRVHPSLLADGMAVRAHNCVLESGKLVPLRQPAPVSGMSIHMEAGLGSIADAKSLYVWKHTDRNGNVQEDFLAFTGIVDFAEGHIADDQYDRLFVTGKTGMAFTDAKGKTWENSPAMYLYSRQSAAIIRRPVAKIPLAAPSVSPVGTLDENKTIHYSYFFVSWVDDLGLESGLSPASTASSGAFGNTGALMLNSGMSVQFAKIELPTAARKVYIYASAAGSSESTDGIQFMAERPASVAKASNGFIVPFVPENFGESEPGIEAPPGDLSGAQFVAGGYYTAFSPSSPHTVMFSDIGIVTSWPVAYRYDVKDNIVALATTSNSVFALTDGWPWVLTGTAPESMTVAKLAGPAACVSPRGVCVYRNSVYFASNEGLMAIVNDANAGTVCANVTQKIFTKDQWQALNPQSCMMAQHRGRLFMFFRDAYDRPLEGLVVNLNESADAVTTHDEAAWCVAQSYRTDTMYYVRDASAGTGVQHGDRV